jgi:hypothetical protein
MPGRYEDRQELSTKIDYEGGIFDALQYGITSADMPEGDTDLTAAWNILDVAWVQARAAAAAVEKLLPPPAGE